MRRLAAEEEEAGLEDARVCLRAWLMMRRVRRAASALALASTSGSSWSVRRKREGNKTRKREWEENVIKVVVGGPEYEVGGVGVGFMVVEEGEKGWIAKRMRRMK